MSLLEHLEELRFVLMKSLSALVVGAAVVGYLVFFQDFMDVFYWPLERAQQMQQLDVGHNMLRSLSPMSVFSSIIQVIAFGGFGLSSPFILYFVATFVAPGLTPREKRVLLPVCLAIMVLFLAGALFSYTIVLPFSLSVSLQLNALLGFEPIWEAAAYFGLITWMTVGLGIAFQFPMVLVLLQYLKVVSPRQLGDGRRYAVVILMIFSALMTPGGDFVTLILMTLPLYLLYEVAIAVGKRLKNAQDRTENC